MKTLFQRVFDGNDAMYALAVKAVDEAVAKLGPDAPATFGDTAYSLPCFYAMTGKKYMHFVWHLFVLAGSILHYFSVYFYVL